MWYLDWWIRRDRFWMVWYPDVGYYSYVVPDTWLISDKQGIIAPIYYTTYWPISYKSAHLPKSTGSYWIQIPMILVYLYPGWIHLVGMWMNDCTSLINCISRLNTDRLWRYCLGRCWICTILLYSLIIDSLNLWVWWWQLDWFWW